MATPNTATIRNELARLLLREVSFDDFWEWLHGQQLAVRDDPEAKTLLYRIIGRLDEYDNGDWSDEQLHSHFATLAWEPTVVTISGDFPRYTIATSNTTMNLRVEAEIPASEPAGTLRSPVVVSL